MTDGANDSEPSVADAPASPPSGRKQLLRLAVVIAVIAAAWFLIGRFGWIDYLAQREAELKAFGERHPWLAVALAFGTYVIVTGASLPGAALLTLICAWYFGFARSVVLVSFASTLGATLAFLTSRYLARDWVRARLGDRLAAFDRAVEREGAYYLFTLRLVPAVPFFVINAAMGLTPLKTRTFWWVSQLGMLPGTLAYCWAGSEIPNLATLRDEGLGAVVSPQLMIAFVLLGVLPLILKRLLDRFRAPLKRASSDPVDGSTA